ncbi:ROK family protein [Nocardia sp. NPDC056100]|uniref:ROK family protein n=1 Tax=Nocardia sp. NPDC056100 TaxID=3345712 RepID=UPI0035DDBE02
MTVLALEVGAAGFAVTRVAEDVSEDEIRRIPMPSGKPWDKCRELLLEVAAGAEVTALGIACSGPVDMGAGVVASTEIPQWRTGFAIVDAARKVFPKANVSVALDGVCLALAERSFGAAQGVLDALAVSASEQLSGGMTVGGFAVVGRTGNAGSIAHTLVPGFDVPCECGGHGCLQAVASGAAIRAWAQEQGWGGDTLVALLTAAQQGDGVAIAALGRAGTALGRAIASTAALLDLDLVVIGGSMASAGPALWKPLGEAVAEHARLGYLAGLRVVPSALGDLGVLAGAGVLAMLGDKSS